MQVCCSSSAAVALVTMTAGVGLLWKLHSRCQASIAEGSSASTKAMSGVILSSGLVRL